MKIEVLKTWLEGRERYQRYEDPELNIRDVPESLGKVMCAHGCARDVSGEHVTGAPGKARERLWIDDVLHNNDMEAAG